MKIYSLFTLALLGAHQLFAQPSYNKTDEYLNANKYWPIQEYSAVSFFDGTIKKDTSALHYPNENLTEATSAVCHPVSGKLLFYANFNAVYNAKHEVMLNGNGIMGHPSGGHAMVIVPYMGDSNLYYLFHYTNGLDGVSPHHILYSVVDMRLDNGNGGVVANKKNVMLDGDSFIVKEGLYAIAGENCDIWLIANSQETSSWILGKAFYRAYHITENGINTKPVISASAMQGFYSNLQLSSKGKWVVNTPMVGEGVELLAFDAKTGEFTSKHVLPIGFRMFFGGTTMDGVLSAAFSPDESKLYLSYFSGLDGKVVQLDLSKEHTDSIMNSEKVIHENITNSLKIYNDTMYSMRFSQPITIERYSNLNAPAEQVKYEKDLLQFDHEFGSRYLGAEVVYPTTFVISSADTQACTDEFVFASSDEEGKTFLWNDGSTQSTNTITASGTHWVQSKKLNNHCVIYVVDTFKVTILPSVDEPVISVNEFELSVQQQTNVTYQWILNGTDINGATDYKYAVTQNGGYQVRVTSTLPGECTMSSSVYTVNNHTNVATISENTIKVYPNPTQGTVYIDITSPFKAEILDITGRVLLTATEKNINLQAFANGVYQLVIYNQEEQLIYQTKITKK